MSASLPTEQSVFSRWMLGAHAYLNRPEPVFAFEWFKQAYQHATTTQERVEALIMMSEALTKQGRIFEAADSAQEAANESEQSLQGSSLYAMSLVALGRVKHLQALHVMRTKDNDDDLAFDKRESPELLRQANKLLRSGIAELEGIVRESDSSDKEQLFLVQAYVAYGLLKFDLSRQPARRKRYGITKRLSRSDKQGLRQRAVSKLREAVLLSDGSSGDAPNLKRLHYEALLAIIQCRPLPFSERVDCMDDAHTLAQALGHSSKELQRSIFGRRWVIRHQVKQIIRTTRVGEVEES